MTYVVTGGAGFIGSNYVKFLNEKGIRDVIIVDDLTSEKLANIRNLDFKDYLDKEYLFDFMNDECSTDDILVHLGANSNTTCKDKSIIEDNYSFTRNLLGQCLAQTIPLIYASSASVYGNKKDGTYDPLCMYAFSKMIMDKYIDSLYKENPHLSIEWPMVVGLRFFNVYGSGESHKGSQASVIYNWHKQVKENNEIRVFKGENLRDFVCVEDVCKVIHHFASNPNSDLSKVYDVGSGVARDFKEIAHIMAQRLGANIAYINMPDELKDQYQTFTQANLDALREAGYVDPMTPLEEGVEKYLDILER